MALSSNKARELRRRQAEKARRAPTMKPSIQARKQAEALTKRAPVNRFGSATPKANTGRTVTKNNNFDKFQKQVADNTAVTKTGNFATDRRNNNKISEQFGATSNIPESNVTQSETDRRNRASDKNLGINQNNPFLGRDPNTIVGGTVAQSKVLAEQARINKGKQEKGFNDFKTAQTGGRVIGLDIGKFYATGEGLSENPEIAAAQRQALGRGRGNGLDSAGVKAYEDLLLKQYQETGEFKALQDEGQVSALDLSNRARQSTFGGSTLTETQVRDSMGLKAGQNLFWNEESNKYEVRTGAIEDSDPFVRAEEALQLKKDNAIEDVNEQYKNAISRAEANVAQYGNNQARTHLADLLKRKKKSIDRITEQVDTSMEELVIQEEQRQSGIEEVLLAGDEPLDVDTQKKLDLANYITQEQAKDPSLTATFLESKYKDINKYDSSTDNAKVIGTAAQSIIDSDQLNTEGYSTVIGAAEGIEEDAYKGLKSRVGVAKADEVRGQWMKANGYDQERIDIKNIKSRKQDLIDNGGDDLAFSQLLEDLGEDKIREGFLYDALGSSAVKGDARTFLQSKLADMLGDTNQFELRSVGNTLLSVNPNTNESSVIFQGEEKDDAFTTQQKFSNTMSIRRDYQTQSKNFTLTRDNFNKIKALSSADDFTTGASDISLVFSYMKMLDPTSVVRDTEFATAANSGGVPAAILNTYNRLKEGQFLTPVQRADFTKAAKSLFGEQLKVQQDRQAEFRATAESFDLDPEKAVPDYVSGFERDEMSDLIDTEPSYTSADLSALGVDQSQVDGLTPEAQTSFNEAMGNDQGADMIDALLRDGLTLPLAIQIYQEEPKIDPVGTGELNTQLSRPERNKNPGNVKVGGVGDKFALKDENGKPVVDDQNHLVFANPTDGFNAFKADIDAKVNGRSRWLENNPTLAELGKVYAEDPNWPIAIARMLDVDVNTATQDLDLDELSKAIIRQEGGSKLIAQL